MPFLMTHCKKHPDHKTETHCKLCLEPYCTHCISHPLHLCEGCMYKVGIVILIVMIAISFMAWMSVI